MSSRSVLEQTAWDRTHRGDASQQHEYGIDNNFLLVYDALAAEVEENERLAAQVAGRSQRSDWMWIAAGVCLLVRFGLAVFGAKPEVVQGAWELAVVVMLTAVGMQIREGRKP